MMSKNHYFFVLPHSPWPLLISINSFNLLFSLIIFLKYFYNFNFIMSLICLFLNSFFWWVHFSGESILQGKDSIKMIQGIKYSMILFISSEIFFFFSFFWSYFHFFLSPNMEISSIWPPEFIQSFDCSNVPLINTLILVSSGVTVTISHNYLNLGRLFLSNLYLFFTITLGVLFSFLQWFEYINSFFSISDSTFGSSFFMLTGFHGIHVIIGFIFLFTVLYRIMKLSSTTSNSLSFEMAAWYWHFVDVIWLFLYFFLYYMNN